MSYIFHVHTEFKTWFTSMILYTQRYWRLDVNVPFQKILVEKNITYPLGKASGTELEKAAIISLDTSI